MMFSILAAHIGQRRSVGFANSAPQLMHFISWIIVQLLVRLNQLRCLSLRVSQFCCVFVRLRPLVFCLIRRYLLARILAYQ